MLKQKSKLLSFFIIFMIIFSISACSESTDGGSNTPNGEEGNSDDATPPRILKAEINNSTQPAIILTFDETVKINNTNGFSVNTMLNKSSVLMTGDVEGSGTSTIYISLSRNITSREIATISYDGTGNVRDLAGNELLSFTNMLLLPVDSSPEFRRATVENLTPYNVDVEFTEPVVINDASGFLITINGSGATIINITSGSGSDILTSTGSGSDIITSTGSGSDVISFTLDQVVMWGDDVAIEYDADMGGEVQDLDGNPLASFGPETVANNIMEDVTPPEFLGAAVWEYSPNTIYLMFSESLYNLSSNGFTLIINDSTISIDSIDYYYYYDSLSIYLEEPVNAGDNVTIQYSSGPGTITDTAGNPLGSFDPRMVSVNITNPEFVNAFVYDSDPADVVAGFNKEITMSDATGFTITVNGSGATIIGTSSGSGSDIITYTGSGSYVMTFNLAEPVEEGDSVLISYNSASGGDARDYNNNYLQSFGPIPVTNYVGAAVYTIETFSNGGGSDADTYLYLYDSGYNLLFSNDDGGEWYYSKIVQPLWSGETYYIEVQDYFDQGDYYSILVDTSGGGISAITPAVNAGEPNNDFEHATPLTAGTIFNSCLSPIGETDIYVITIP